MLDKFNIYRDEFPNRGAAGCQLETSRTIIDRIQIGQWYGKARGNYSFPYGSHEMRITQTVRRYITVRLSNSASLTEKYRKGSGLMRIRMTESWAKRWMMRRMRQVKWGKKRNQAHESSMVPLLTPNDSERRGLPRSNCL